MAHDYIQLERFDRVARITLNRPEAMNALSEALMNQVGEALLALDADDAIGAIVITGNDKAFAAGADIKDMAKLDMAGAMTRDFPFSASGWHVLNRLRKPLIAAVSGVCLGGGCELAMACDMIIAADNARFGQPEVKLGIIPGAGGTQRLVRAIGKSKAMDMCLTGRSMDAMEAERSGLVARVTTPAELQETALATAKAIAGQSMLSTILIKEAVNQAFEIPLTSGLTYERRLFQSTLATEDRGEGMAAFIEKRTPRFRHR